MKIASKYLDIPGEKIVTSGRPYTEEAPAFSSAVALACAYLQNNSCAPEQISALVLQLHEVAMTARRDEQNRVHSQRELKAVYSDDVVPMMQRSAPIVPIDQTVFDDHIICLEDGQRVKVLSRYLKSHFNMTPSQYRIKWGLPQEYPMVPPQLSKTRAANVRKIKPHLARWKESVEE